MVKLFELLAYLKEVLNQQQEVIRILEAESMGFNEPFEKTVKGHFAIQDNCWIKTRINQTKKIYVD